MARVGVVAQCWASSWADFRISTPGPLVPAVGPEDSRIFDSDQSGFPRAEPVISIMAGSLNQSATPPLVHVDMPRVLPSSCSADGRSSRRGRCLTGEARCSSGFERRRSFAGMAEIVFNVEVPPSGPGCVECDAENGWWVALRRCAVCGHVGCCDSSPSQHATAHFEATGHKVMQSYEPGQDWMWDYVAADYVTGPELAPPTSHPSDQPTPGPAGRVPTNWRDLIHR